ncbi:hypothetical protein VFPPC_09019 [Pochonia chlamydosporia 170]|uniref:Uncharacterized protein n=1 Tax=Pochonia chlamydosporia 170 TaxID=1380566 RepID=A0A179FCU4_METCM|nr:hypothetical protein VFPPC_09019 [Pochonia chlamydosporia 170]OAQ63120.1 hypothetical protein VFPPC_09019 [Pochonia chlamydosporia 170]
MKLSTIIAGTFAAIAAAAPAPAPEAQAEPGTSVALPVFERASFDAGKLNNLNFKQQDLRYLFKMNSLDLNLLQVLGRQNNFNVLAFANVFNNDAFNLNALLQFQQLQTILAIAQTGVFNQFDLAGLNLAGLNLGVINGIGAFDIASIVDVAVIPQIQTVVQTITPTVILT